MDINLMVKKWRIVLASLAITVPLGMFFPESGEKALSLLWVNVFTILGILPPVFILLGLFDTWVPRERVAPHLGENSRIKGVVLAIALGASSAGPLYIAFPVAEVMLRKGASLRNVFIFIGTWSTMRIPMILFEIQSMGFAFGLSRYAASLVGILLMSFLTERLLGGEEKRSILLRYREK